MYSYRTLALPPTEVGGEAFSLAPSDEGAVERLRETGGETFLQHLLSLRHLLCKCHLPRQREASAAAGLLIGIAFLEPQA